jgi:hypothetical protein
MLRAISTPSDRRRTLLLLALAVIFGLGAAASGLDDNPPGLILAFLSAATFGAALVHPWRSARSFRRLMYASGLGFLASVILHNALHAAASVPGLPPLAHDVLSAAGVLFFFTAVLACPPLFLLGAVGAVAMSRRKSDS